MSSHMKSPKGSVVRSGSGSPGMNFLPCTVNGDHVRVDDIPIALDQAKEGRLQPHEEEQRKHGEPANRPGVPIASKGSVHQQRHPYRNGRASLE